MTNMFNTEVDSLLQVTVSNDLVHDDADSRWSDVVHDSGASSDHDQQWDLFDNRRNTPMVIFMGHALLLRSVCFDVNNIPYMVVDEERRQFYGAML